MQYHKDWSVTLTEEEVYDLSWQLDAISEDLFHIINRIDKVHKDKNNTLPGQAWSNLWDIKQTATSIIAVRVGPSIQQFRSPAFGCRRMILSDTFAELKKWMEQHPDEVAEWLESAKPYQVAKS